MSLSLLLLKNSMLKYSMLKFFSIRVWQSANRTNDFHIDPPKEKINQYYRDTVHSGKKKGLPAISNLLLY